MIDVASKELTACLLKASWQGRSFCIREDFAVCATAQAIEYT
jgi:hypothetical protein